MRVSGRDVERTIEVLEISDEHEKQALRSFWAREAEQDRTANIKLLKALGVFALKVIAISLIVLAFFQTWTERLPR